MSLKLRIISPEKILFIGDVESVIVPGLMGEFQIRPSFPALKRGASYMMMHKDDIN